MAKTRSGSGRLKARITHPLWRSDEYAVRQEMSEADALAIERAISKARSENPIQTVLQERPAILAQLLHGGHGRWVVPKQRLGVQYVTDLLIGDADSIGDHWTAIELERPNVAAATKEGRPSAALRRAIGQIHDWREWLRENLGYATREREREGLGLRGIDPEVRGMVIIGRRPNEDDPKFARERRRLSRTDGIDVHTYDWLLERTVGLFHERTEKVETELRARVKGRIVAPQVRRRARK